MMEDSQDSAMDSLGQLLAPPVTISNFDESESSSSSETLETQKLLRRIPHEIFLVSLLEELCACYAKDSGQQKNLFKVLSGYLSKAKMIPVTTTQEEFQQVRTKYRMAIKKFLQTALSQADPEERYLSLPSAGVGEQIKKSTFGLIKPNPMHYQLLMNKNIQLHMPNMIPRYKKDFVEIERIGRGGFGSVYKVRSILDKQEYAIKKIKLKGTDKEFYEKVIREVKLLAGMQHQNIVRYNTAWIDHQPSTMPTPRNNLPAIEYPMNPVFNRQESLSSDDLDGLTSNITGGETSCVITDVTYELLKEDCIINCDPNVDEEIDESDVEITFDGTTYNESDVEITFDGTTFNDSNENLGNIHATTSSQHSTTILSSEKLNATIKEEFSVDFDADYCGHKVHQVHSTTVVSSSVETDISPSKETNGINLSGRFGVFDGFQSNTRNFRSHTKGVRFDDSKHISNGFHNSDYEKMSVEFEHCSISSTACMGARKEPKDSNCQDRKDTSEFENSKVILYIQMELCSRTLGDWLEERNERNPLPGADVFSIVDDCVNQSVLKQMVDGISYIHQKNLLHRDLKPKNIFLAGPEHEFHVCIGDFGLARQHQPVKLKDPVTPLVTLHNQLAEVVIPASKLTTDIGTWTYASPEQLHGSTYDHKSDMYSLGMICFELYHPFKTQMEKSKCLKALRNDRLIPDEIHSKWPDEFIIIEQLTSENPDMRPSAEELKKGKLFMTNDELIKCLRSELKEKDSIIEKLRLEIKMIKT